MATSLDKSRQMDMEGLAIKAKDLDLSGALDVTGNAAIKFLIELYGQAS